MARKTNQSGNSLDKAQIFKGALKLLDTEGTESFTVSSIAKHLGVQGPSLYAHVSGKAEIIEGVRELVVANIDYSSFASAPWDIALKSWARSYLAAFSAHPNTIVILATTPVSTDQLIKQYDAAAESLFQAGWLAAEVMHLITAIESFVLGSALDVVAPNQMVIVENPLSPSVSQALIAQSMKPSRAAATFEMGLEALVDGFRFRLNGRVATES